jgi:hypothetical protein
MARPTFHATRIDLHGHFVEVGEVSFARAALRRAARAKEEILLGRVPRASFEDSRCPGLPSGRTYGALHGLAVLAKWLNDY